MKRRLFKNSAILNGLGRIADGLYDAMAKSATGRALTSYDNDVRKKVRHQLDRIGKADLIYRKRSAEEYHHAEKQNRIIL